MNDDNKDPPEPERPGVVIPLPTGGSARVPQQEWTMAAILQDFAREVQREELVAIAIIGIRRDGSFHTAWTGGAGLHGILGSVVFLQDQILQKTRVPR